jgi:hypothetical protein
MGLQGLPDLVIGEVVQLLDDFQQRLVRFDFGLDPQGIADLFIGQQADTDHQCDDFAIC